MQEIGRFCFRAYSFKWFIPSVRIFFSCFLSFHPHKWWGSSISLVRKSRHVKIETILMTSGKLSLPLVFVSVHFLKGTRQLKIGDCFNTCAAPIFNRVILHLARWDWWTYQSFLTPRCFPLDPFLISLEIVIFL